MKRNVLIAASILDSDFAHLEDEVKAVEKLGADYIHYDIMDGHFVNNISFGSPVVKKISPIHSLVNDVHLMISEPEKYFDKFIEAGADIITFHYEAVKEEEINSLIDYLHSKGVKAGLSIKPATPAEKIFKYLDKLDLLLVMSVEPGFGGQSFMESALAKISAIRKYIDENAAKCVIEVDGGINEKTARDCALAGVDVLVVGSFLYKNDKAKAMASLKEAINV
ncbi:MAG: ribulose-phosphate 3-epimerase [Coprobacillus sp.]|nr:ribulose-phosphate 3-epimerase [Coprobacillus sp.]